MNIPLSWREKVIYPVIAAVMIGCCLFAVAQAAERFVGTRLDLYIVTFVGALAAFQSFYTQRLTTDVRMGGAKKGVIYLLELALLLVLAKIGVLVSDVITGHPVSFNFFSFDLRWAMVITLMVLSWVFARTAAVQFSRLHKLPAHRQETETIDGLWVSPYDALSSLFFRGGIVLMFFSGLARAGLGNLEDIVGPPATGIVLNALVYFGMGLILLGQANFDGIRRRWFVEEVKVAEQTDSRWLRYSLILIGLAALIAFLAPIRYSLNLLDALRVVLDVLASIVSLLLIPVALLISLLERLFRLLFGQAVPAGPAPSLPNGLPPQQGAAANGLLEWLSRLDWASIQSILSWLIALVVIIYVIRSYLRDNIEFSVRLGKIGIFRLLSRLWQAIWQSLVGVAEDASEATAGILQRLAGRQGLLRRPLSRLLLGQPTPRERIRYLYLSALNRAASRGIGRKHDQTPYEYEEVLGPNVPDAEQDVVQLTQAFVEARYSQQPMENGNIAPVYQAWLRLRAALRRAHPIH